MRRAGRGEQDGHVVLAESSMDWRMRTVCRTECSVDGARRFAIVAKCVTDVAVNDRTSRMLAASWFVP
jgi:hypothetical protein